MCVTIRKIKSIIVVFVHVSKHVKLHAFPELRAANGKMASSPLFHCRLD